MKQKRIKIMVKSYPCASTTANNYLNLKKIRLK